MTHLCPSPNELMLAALEKVLADYPKMAYKFFGCHNGGNSTEEELVLTPHVAEFIDTQTPVANATFGLPDTARALASYIATMKILLEDGVPPHIVQGLLPYDIAEAVKAQLHVEALAAIDADDDVLAGAGAEIRNAGC
ncbi:MAG: hypothetical protein WAX89_04115 [Alphaproteobacteria bacterium]